MSEFRMPQLGADMEAGTLVSWMKQPGDVVHRGDIIAVVDTQKGAIEVEVFEDGVVERLLVHPGEQAAVGTALAVIGTGAAAPAPTTPAVAAPQAAPPPATAPQGAPAPSVPMAAAGERRRVSPAARRAADVLRVDLAAVKGTGPGGAVTVADVERSAGRIAAPTSPPAVAVSGMRMAIGAAMTRSKHEIPHFYLTTTIDMSTAEAWLAAENARRPVTDRLLPVVLLIKAVAHALGEVPELNGYWAHGAFQAGSGIHVGSAITLRGGGLVAPALHDVDRKTLDTIMIELRDMVTRARSGTLRSSELSDSTITVTNLGDRGAESGIGIIFPPQVALVCFGRMVRRPWAVGDAVAVRPVITTTLSADHRVIDGHRGGLFLAAIERRLQSPETL